MATVFVLEVDETGAETRNIEVHHIARAMQLATQAVKSAGGAVLSGDIRDAGKLLGRWRYQPTPEK